MSFPSVASGDLLPFVGPLQHLVAALLPQSPFLGLYLIKAKTTISLKSEKPIILSDLLANQLCCQKANGNICFFRL